VTRSKIFPVASDSFMLRPMIVHLRSGMSGCAGINFCFGDVER